MNIEKQVKSNLATLSPLLGKLSRREKIFAMLMTVLIVLGIYALYLQISRGHVVTGTRDNVVWGIYIVNFIFMIGLGYAGSVIAALLHLFRIPWRFPIIRIALIMAVIAAIIGPMFIIFEVGRLDRLHYLFIYARLQSPITWDVLAVITYIVGSILFLYLTLVKDFSILRTSPDLSAKRKKWYSRLSLGFNNSLAHSKKLELSGNIIALLIIPVAIIVSSILSWIFGMTLRPGWHSTIFGPYFVLAAIYSGTGMVIVLMYIYRKFYNLGEFFTDMHFRYMGYIMITLGVGYAYFTFSEYFTDWYTSKTWEAMLIDKLFDFEQYGAINLATNLFGILLPLLIIGLPWFRNTKTISLVALVMVISMWIKRYLIVIPTLETTLIPMQEVRPEYVSYTATWVEWSLVAGGFGLFGLLFLLITKFITIIPIWGTAESKLRSESKSIVSVDLKSPVAS